MNEIKIKWGNSKNDVEQNFEDFTKEMIGKKVANQTFICMVIVVELWPSKCLLLCMILTFCFAWSLQNSSGMEEGMKRGKNW